MRFFLVGRHRDTGDVRLVSQGTYETRQEALDDLGSAMPADGSLAGHDLFVVDLDAATPVVVYQAPPAPAAEPLAEEPIADVWEAPAPAVDALAEIAAVEDAALEGAPPVWGAAAAEEPVAEEAEASVEATEEEVAIATASSAAEAAAETSTGLEPDAPEADVETLDLADALRRAATQMESEGVVPAPGVEELAALSAVPEGAEAVTVLDEVEPAVDAEPGLKTAPAAWPWEAVEGAPAAETPAEEPGGLLPSFTPVGIDEPGLEDMSLLTVAEGEGLLDARPVIVGEYPDAADAAAEADAPAEEPMAEEAPASEPEPAAASEPAYGDIAAAAAAVYENAEAAAQAELKAYEPGGMDIATYTCEDCVYVDTCPKAKQDGPATCGSFQWKSV